MDFLSKVAGGFIDPPRAQRIVLNIEHLQFLQRVAKVRQVGLVADLVEVYE